MKMFTPSSEGMFNVMRFTGHWSVHEYNTLFDVKISVEKSKIMKLNGKEEVQSYV